MSNLVPISDSVNTPNSTASSSMIKQTPTLNPIPTPTSTSSGQDKIKLLEEELAQLRARLGDRDPKEINKNHIELLHTYNEIKDGTQALIGRYAAMNHKTVGQVHVELSLPLTD
ncbi:hypothetical protein IAT40_003637 [Kwoniella sp. CBS 6097]